jgi:hypothetical protein
MCFFGACCPTKIDFIKNILSPYKDLLYRNMSFFVLSFVRVDDSHGPCGIYKTQDEAIHAAITRFGWGKLYQTSDGTVWYNCGDMTNPIKLNKLMKSVRRTGIFNCRDAFDNESCPHSERNRYCKITKLTLDKSPMLEIEKVNYNYCVSCGTKITEENACELDSQICNKCLVYCSLCNSEEDIQENIAHPFSPKDCYQCPKCKKWFCYTGDHVGTHNNVCAAEKNQQSSTNFLTLIKQVYRNGKNVIFSTDEENGILVVKLNNVIVAIGANLDDRKIKVFTEEQIAKILELGLEIDQSWRGENMESIPYADYWKMSSRKE